MFYFWKEVRNKQQGVFAGRGWWGAVFLLQGMLWKQLAPIGLSEVPGRTPASRALPEFLPLVSCESRRSHQSQESEQTPGDGEGQGSLACCSPWGCGESDTTECLNTTSTQITAGCGEGTAHTSPERGACHVTRVPRMRAASSSWCSISNNLFVAV